MFSHDHTVLAAHNWHNFGTGAGTINGTGTSALARAHWHWHWRIGTGTGALARARARWHWHRPDLALAPPPAWALALAPPRIRLLRRRWTSNRGTFTINRYWHWHATWHHWHWHLWHGHWALWHGHLALWHGHWHYDWHDWHDWHMMVAPSPKTDRSGVPTGPRSRERSRLSEAPSQRATDGGQCKPPRRGAPPSPRTHARISFAPSVICICMLGLPSSRTHRTSVVGHNVHPIVPSLALKLLRALYPRQPWVAVLCCTHGSQYMIAWPGSERGCG